MAQDPDALFLFGSWKITVAIDFFPLPLFAR